MLQLVVLDPRDRPGSLVREETLRGVVCTQIEDEEDVSRLRVVSITYHYRTLRTTRI